jgi:hypothetical protein
MLGRYGTAPVQHLFCHMCWCEDTGPGIGFGIWMDGRNIFFR